MVRRKRFAELLGVGVVAAALLSSLAGAGLWPGAAARAVAPLAAVLHTGASGFAVAPGFVITDAHFTRSCQLAGLPIASGAGPGEWRVLREEPDLDLALLAAPRGQTTPQVPPLPLSAVRRLSPGTAVLVIGTSSVKGQVTGEALTVHQPGAGLARSLHLADATGRAFAPTWQDGIAYFGAGNAGRLRWVVQINAGTRPGDSGGPVVDGAGAVVGVVFAGQPNGPTSAVVLTDLMDFLARAEILPQFVAPPEGAPDWSAAARAARGVVRLEC